MYVLVLFYNKPEQVTPAFIIQFFEVWTQPKDSFYNKFGIFSGYVVIL